jgi:hypothetical protein
MLKLFMLSCEKATALVEKKRTLGLSFLERYRLNLHQKVCGMCQHYEQQSVLIDQYIEKKITKREVSDVDLGQVKKSILTKLENAQK